MGDGLEALPASHGQDDDGDVSGRWVGGRARTAAAGAPAAAAAAAAAAQKCSELARKKKIILFYK